MDLGLKCNMDNPYPVPAAFDGTAETVYGKLVALLQASGASVVASDIKELWLSWTHRPDYFTALMTYADRQTGIIAKPVSPGIVHGCAQVKPNGQGSAVHMHAVLRDKKDGSSHASNGDYEALISRALSKQLAAGS